MHSIVSIDRIHREAADAARAYSDVNDACPYPFGTDAAHAFVAEFHLRRAEITQAQASPKALTTSE